MKQTYLIVAVLLVVLLGGFFFLKGSKPTSTPPQPFKHPAALPKEVTVTLDKNGFTPKEVTIAVGSAVRWENTSGDKQTVNSDNFPTNQLHKELNFGVFANNSSVVYIFMHPGTYGYHNQFHPEQNGKVKVVVK
jgi:plastocyanin